MDVPAGPRSMGAYHSGDLAYVFGNVGLVGLHWQPRDHELADEMSRHWVQFATTGNPNGPGLPNWPAYEPQNHTAMRYAETSRAAGGFRQRQLDSFDPLLRSLHRDKATQPLEER